jgi:hypothetical protein
MATSATPFPAAFGSYGDPSASTTTNSGAGGRVGVDPRKKKLIYQIMANRMQAGQGKQMMTPGGGGPGYMDYVDQLRMNPMNTWY